MVQRAPGGTDAAGVAERLRCAIFREIAKIGPSDPEVIAQALFQAAVCATEASGADASRWCAITLIGNALPDGWEHDDDVRPAVKAAHAVIDAVAGEVSELLDEESPQPESARGARVYRFPGR